MSRGAIHIGIDAVALSGPGLRDWVSSQPVLAGAAAYHPTPTRLEAPEQLSAAERRRAIPSVKLALAVGSAALATSGLDPRTLPAVFASSGADGETVGAILTSLATASREVSPTRFHNSVHNAPSGYWGVAMQSREAVTSISCHDASFAAGLLEAAVQTVAGARPTLLVAYDLPYPKPLDQVRPIHASFGVALVLTPASSNHAVADLHLHVGARAGAQPTGCTDPALEALRRGNPAARCLPLLNALAGGSSGCIRFDLSHTALEVGVLTC